MTQTPTVPTATSNDELLFNKTVEFLKANEGFEPVARPPVGIKGGKTTYGYGFEFKQDNQTRVTDGEIISEEEADQLLRYKVEELHNSFSDRYEQYRNLPASVKAGVLSFGFNAGINVFDDGRNQKFLRPALDSGDPERLKKAMGLFVYGPQGSDPILKMRRLRELQMMNDPNFLGEDLYNPFNDGTTPTSASQAVGP